MADAGDALALYLLLGGRVQGVGYRAFVRDLARRLGLVGWVRNLPDGRVEIEVAGPRAVVERFRAELRRGSPPARVSSFEESELREPLQASSFDIVF